MTELACRYKTYRLLDLSRSAVYTVDPANVEYMLKTNFANYGKGLYMHSILSDVLGNGIFAVDGGKWRHQRKALSSEFSTKMLRDFSSAVFKLGAVKLARVIATCDQAIEIQDLLMKSSLDSIIKILLGIELDSLSGTNEEGNRFSIAFDQANETTMFRFVDIFWKIKRFLNIGREAVLRENSSVIDQFVYKLIKSKIEIMHHLEDKQSLITKRDFVSRLLDSNETDPKYLRDMVLSFMVAGKDSLAVTPSWFLYMMCKHLQIQEKIAQEVREVINLKDNSSVDELAASLTDEALKKMQYLHAALTETIRLYPAVPMDAKMCFSDDTWPDGLSVKKGDVIVYQPYAMGRMKFLWGDDAEEFRPERWLDKNGQFQDESPFKFTAFQAGPRICPGQEHAYMYMKIFSAVLLGSYIFKLADETKVVNYKTMVSLQIDGGLYLHATPRSGNGRPYIPCSKHLSRLHYINSLA
ncbi:cytochrome P450 704C1 isoform X2 [Rosa chinensis]|nr:cytochrome P450 704C1 isoform X2 [Rosa chinensis]